MCVRENEYENSQTTLSIDLPFVENVSNLSIENRREFRTNRSTNYVFNSILMIIQFSNDEYYGNVIYHSYRRGNVSSFIKGDLTFKYKLLCLVSLPSWHEHVRNLYVNFSTLWTRKPECWTKYNSHVW